MPASAATKSSAWATLSCSKCRRVGVIMAAMFVPASGDFIMIESLPYVSFAAKLVPAKDRADTNGTYRPYPEEPCVARRLEGWPPARSRLRPSFETPASRAPQDEAEGRQTYRNIPAKRRIAQC